MTSEINSRIYVVEKLVEMPAEAPEATIKNWVSVHTTEDPLDAVKVAKEEAVHWPRVRVRQFWVAKTIPQRDTLRPEGVETGTVPLVDWTCLDHRKQVVHTYQTGDVRCPECSKAMVLVATAEALDAGPVADFSGGVP